MKDYTHIDFSLSSLGDHSEMTKYTVYSALNLHYVALAI